MIEEIICFLLMLLLISNDSTLFRACASDIDRIVRSSSDARTFEELGVLWRISGSPEKAVVLMRYIIYAEKSIYDLATYLRSITVTRSSGLRLHECEEDTR